MAYIAIGVMRSYRGKNVMALEAFQEGARREPADAINIFYLGYGLANVGRVEEAKAAYKRANALGHGDVKKDAEAAMRALNKK
jgi:Flp pilus assembly protein TadD